MVLGRKRKSKKEEEVEKVNWGDEESEDEDLEEDDEEQEVNPFVKKAKKKTNEEWTPERLFDLMEGNMSKIVRAIQEQNNLIIFFRNKFKV